MAFRTWRSRSSPATAESSAGRRGARPRARNGILLLMVLFENFQAGNSRSETRSVFRLSPLKNPILLFGTFIAQLVHIGALYTPGLREVLRVQPVTLGEWGMLLVLALSLLGVMEGDKALRRARNR